MSKRYKLILFVRFFGYLLFFAGLVSLIFLLGPLTVAEVKYRVDRVLGVKRTITNVITSSTSQESKPTWEVSQSGPGSFNNIQTQENQIVPISTEFGIVIEKINANARVVPNINASDEKEYVQALTQGVAQALGSTPPGQPGNLYLFSHSTDAPWNIIRFNAIFYLLKELEAGDRVIVFYANRRYDYIVFDKIIAKPDDVSYLTNRYDTPILTLQTCDPPGTLLNRLVVRAKLVNS